MKPESKYLILFALCGSCLLQAQGDPRGAIFGHITDPTSAVVAGAKVIVKNTLTSVVTELTTNEQGYYEAPLLIAGTYQVSVTATGFLLPVRDPRVHDAVHDVYEEVHYQ